jgi:hypothetical protein
MATRGAAHAHGAGAARVHGPLGLGRRIVRGPARPARARRGAAPALHSELTTTRHRRWTAAVGTAAQSERRREGRGVRAGGGREGRDGAVGTPARDPDNAFNTRELRGAWQPRGPGVARGV